MRKRFLPIRPKMLITPPATRRWSCGRFSESGEYTFPKYNRGENPRALACIAKLKDAGAEVTVTESRCPFFGVNLIHISYTQKAYPSGWVPTKLSEKIRPIRPSTSNKES